MVVIEEGIKSFRDSISDRKHKLIFDIIYQTGCTVSELANLMVEHVDLSQKRIIIPEQNTKNHVKRVVSMDSALRDCIREFIGELNAKKDSVSCVYLFSSRQRERLSTRRIEQIFSFYSDMSRIKITPRVLRRLYLKKRGSACKDRSELKEITGLKNLKKPGMNFFHLFQAAGSRRIRDQIIFLILAETGCKTKELSSLRVSDFRNGSLVFRTALKQKAAGVNGCSGQAGNRARKIHVSGFLGKLVRDYTKDMGRNDFIFKGRGGRGITARRIQQIISQMVSTSSSAEYVHGRYDSGRTLNPNIFRRCYANRQYLAGVPVSEIRHNLGIKNLGAFNYGFIETGLKNGMS
ncbi:site-specific integrase [Candidatus Woesearchaeota archaeon]|nr:site-specific integrase [Candidatus Woesearchaeota archaeon]